MIKIINRETSRTTKTRYWK